MNYRLVGRVLGLLLLLLGGMMSLCLLYAYLAGTRATGLDALEGLSISTAVTLVTGMGMWWLGRSAGSSMLRRDAIAVVGLGWLVCAFFGALPYQLCEPRLDFADAYFESMSGFTTTGASVIEDLDRYPRSILMWRSLTQWLGGLGILVLFVALLSYLGVGSKALFRHESSAKSGEGLQARIHDVAGRLWAIYVGLSLICFLGMLGLGMDEYDALVHTFTTISTGGFSPYNDSIGFFDNPWLEIWIMIMMISGSISFMLYAWLLQGRVDRWRKEEETKFYLGFLVAVVVIVALDLSFLGAYPSFVENLRASAFQVVSIMTTTGYVTEDYDEWPAFSRMLLLLLMFMGGCAGSTAGGIKVGRLLLFFRVVKQELIGTFRPNQVIVLHLNGSVADDALKGQAVFLVALAFVITGIATAIVSLLEPSLDILSSLAAVVATLFNIGPGMGSVGPANNYADLGDPTLIILSLMMVLGRLEFFAILVLFLPSLWRKY